MKEIWKRIPKYKRQYEASSLGNIREITDNNEIVIIQKKLTTDGYYAVKLKDDTEPNWTSVHRCVAKAFLPNPDNLSDVDHLDGNIINNCVANLEWVSHAENCRRSGVRRRNQKRLQGGKQPVRCIETGEVYKSMAEASRLCNIRYESILGSIYMKKPVKGKTFERVMIINVE